MILMLIKSDGESFGPHIDLKLLIDNKFYFIKLFISIIA